MKAILLLISVFALAACKKNCQTCTSYVLSPVIGSPGQTTKEPIYTDNKFCEESLENAKKENGKYREVRVGSTLYRFTTIVQCQ